MEYVLKKDITLRQGDDYAGARALSFVGAGGRVTPQWVSCDNVRVPLS